MPSTRKKAKAGDKGRRSAFGSNRCGRRVRGTNRACVRRSSACFGRCLREGVTVSAGPSLAEEGRSRAPLLLSLIMTKETTVRRILRKTAASAGSEASARSDSAGLRGGGQRQHLAPASLGRRAQQRTHLSTSVATASRIAPRSLGV